MNPPKKLYNTLFFLLIFSFASQAQNNSFNTWYFGNGAGLNFNKSKVSSLSNGESYSDEACATVSDENGDLLFYTNGIDIWDKNHEILNPYTKLSGNKSSTQGALIVGNPKEYGSFFIFTVDEKAGGNGLRYSKLNLAKSLNNKKKISKDGAYYTPDMLLKEYNPTLVKLDSRILDNVTEKLTATLHADGKQIWVLAHLWNSNKFCALRISERGIIEEKVLSSAGAIHSNKSKNNNSESIGQMKFSPSGKLLASVICYRNNAPVELFDFDNKTGKLTLKESFNSTGLAYGVEFSPDNSKLYVSYLEGLNTIVQYDLINKNKTTIFKNLNEEIFYGSMQLAPNNKIYIAKTNTYIDVINNPNNPGKLCNYMLSAVNLNNKFSVYGLPSKPIVVIPNKLPKNTISKASTAVNNEPRDTKLKNNLVENCESILEDVSVECITDITLDAGGKNVSYKWSTGERTKQINVNSSNYYSVTLTGKSCKTTKKVYVNIKSKPTQLNYLAEFNPKATFNNYFAFTINDVKDFKLTISKENGKEIFTSSDPKVKWIGRDKNGNQVKPGIYNWEATYKPICSGKEEQKNGIVNVKD